MIRRILGASLCLVVMINAASGQFGNRPAGGNGFGTGLGGMGNAGGFATGSGLSNSFQNSNNFGLYAAPRPNYGAAGPGVMQGVPGVSNYGGGYQSNMGLGAGLPAVGNGANTALTPGAMLPGMVPGIAPPGFTKDMFGYDVGLGSSDSGYTNFGNAITASALGLGYGGMGYGPMGYGGMNYGNMGLGPMGAASFGPMGFTYPGMVPGAFMPGVGYVSPLDVAAASAVNGVPAVSQPVKPGLTKTAADSSNVADDANAGSTDPNVNARSTRAPGTRRSFLNDNVPSATANAIRIQNRMHNVKSPNFKNVTVLMNNRTAILSGTVNSAEDEQLAQRMVGLEPGVVEVKSELVVNGATAK